MDSRSRRRGRRASRARSSRLRIHRQRTAAGIRKLSWPCRSPPERRPAPAHFPGAGHLRNPEILILDEHTSQIDFRSEELIRELLAAHRGKRTIILITHREALLELAAVIYEVRDGQFLESPTTRHH